MPRVVYEGEVIEVEAGANLRRALLDAGKSPYNGRARLVNCRGIGSCGTCAIEVVRGEVGPRTAMERWRLDFPPHDATSGLRLACQIRVDDDLEIRKHPGFWGHRIDSE